MQMNQMQIASLESQDGSFLSDMEVFLKESLNYQYVKKTSYTGGGCINNGTTYSTDQGKIYVKYNSKTGSKIMFQGELESLRAIEATHTVRVPHPVSYLETSPLGSAIVMEHMDMRGLHLYESELGTKLAQMHKSNSVKKASGDTDCSDQFGFQCTTCCGMLPLVNDWNSNWVEFYSRNRLKVQIDMILEKSRADDLSHLWELLQRKLPIFFEQIQVVPALVHGDMWSGNVGEIDTEPVLFDPGCFYGHSEFDFGIASMFGGFSKSFYDSYFAVLPKENGFEERIKLYELFHHLNHWNHFGSGYKGSSIALIRELVG